jgi:signal transduction histidine kinase/CHASE3 domain sensor protein
MNFKAIFQSSLFLKVIFAISLFILIFITSVSYKHSNSLSKTTELLVHSYRIQIQLDNILTYLKDAEIGKRGFIITRYTIYLEPYNSAREKVTRSIRILKELTNGNQKQESNLDTLVSLTELRLALLLNTLQMFYDPGTDKDMLDRNLLEGDKTLAMIQRQVNKMENLETANLKEHQKKYENEISFTPSYTILILAFSLIIFTIAYIKINRDMEILKRTNEDLIITTEAFQHAEEIGGFSNWQWNIDTNIVTYSDNIYRLLRCEPKSLEPLFENFIEFVHPDDKHIITDSINQFTENNSPPVVFFRIILKNGDIRYFKSIGKLIDSHGKKILIGINSDITEQHLSNIALEERNKELEQSNKELASFNHIASHDLQEPLRKIQTFISRIQETDLTVMSESTREYFSRILVSVTRMRTLIDDLLLFSRTNKTEKIFEEADLNILLEDAKQELAQDIEDKSAVIHAGKLPVLNVISFQIKQLFINLIGNSLKYSKPDTPTIIKIDCERILAGEYSVIKDEQYKNYYKISVSDNGLGFEQQFAESIFLLFQRLHHNTEYQGTGIGLAICKKIVENHNGYISAKGEPGIGSTFTFFLPV